MDSPMEHQADVEDLNLSPNRRRDILPTFMGLLGLSGQILFTGMPTIENSRHKCLRARQDPSISLSRLVILCIWLCVVPRDVATLLWWWY
ncbi:hypothetical protein BKA56DRAFT_605904 [Ilyonectria sp. MPI-CAGE-AT-0026]|nr:hypothetical protein BKA56DRAFT_605904 [Ilyonectria sp. MPI-CAGE-AT-0026]